jgi:hypothetical protein
MNFSLYSPTAFLYEVGHDRARVAPNPEFLFLTEAAVLAALGDPANPIAVEITHLGTAYTEKLPGPCGAARVHSRRHFAHKTSLAHRSRCDAQAIRESLAPTVSSE